MKRIIPLIILLLLCGCSSTERYNSAQDKLMKMLAYRANIEIEYISSRGNTGYSAIITADNSGKYKIEATAPENFKGSSILFDGMMIWHYNPNVEEKISINSQDKPERSEINIFSFMENYVKSTDTTVTTGKSEGAVCTVLEADIQGAGKYLVKEKLWINNESLLPEKLVIYDSEGAERIAVTYSGFEYNPRLSEDEFVPQK